MNKASDEALTALRVLFASGLADPLFDEIESVYQSELKAARDRTLQTAKGMIEGQHCIPHSAGKSRDKVVLLT